MSPQTPPDQDAIDAVPRLEDFGRWETGGCVSGRVVAARLARAIADEAEADEDSELKGVHLPASTMFTDDLNNCIYEDPILSLLSAHRSIHTVSLSVPDDLDLGGDPEEHEFRSWGLLRGLIVKFKAGEFREIRFAHPRRYHPHDERNIFAYHNVSSQIEDVLLPEYQNELQSARAWPEPACERLVRAIWTNAGYDLELAEPVAPETGTVLSLRHFPSSRPLYQTAPAKQAPCDHCHGKGMVKVEGYRGKQPIDIFSWF